MRLTKIGLDLVLLWLLLQMDNNPDLAWRIAFPPNGEAIQLRLVRATYPLYAACRQYNQMCGRMG